MNKKGLLLLILFIVFSLIYFFRLKTKLQINFVNGDQVKVVSRLTQEPILQGKYQVFKVNGIFVKTSSLVDYHYGDYLDMTGRVEVKVINKWFNQFWLINPEIVEVKTYSEKLRIKDGLIKNVFKFRQKLVEVFIRTLPEPQASLLIGIVLGVKLGLPVDFYQSLKTTGTLHIIVASGMNISLLAGGLLEILSLFLGRKMALVASLLVVFCYCLMAGLEPPIVRAGLMALVLYLAVFLGRETDGLISLILVAMIMLIFDPLLLFDIGFQLSFMATLGLMVLASRLKNAFVLLKYLKPVSSDLSETLSAQIFTLPILVISFGHFNPLSLLPNVLTLWLIPFLMVLGLLIGFLGLVFWPLALFLSWLLWLPLTYFVNIINWFGQFDVFNLKLENLSWLFGLGYYLLLLGFLSYYQGKKNG